MTDLQQIAAALVPVGFTPNQIFESLQEYRIAISAGDKDQNSDVGKERIARARPDD